MSTTILLSSRQNGSVQQDTRGCEPCIVSASYALLNEMQKSLWLLWRHRAVVLTEFLALVFFYPFLQFVIGNGMVEQALVLPTLLAFLAYPLLFVTTVKFVSDLREEVNSGTFEQMHLSPFSPVFLALGRLIVLILEGVLITIIIGVGMSWLFHVDIPLRVAGALPAALTIIDIMGFALLLGGLALVFPQINVIVSLFSGLIFLFNGTLIPLALYPAWVQILARFLPTTLGIEVTQQVVLENQSLLAVWVNGTLPWLILYSAGLVVVGWLVFLLCDQRVIRRGIPR
jgi:ABC-2 type transport system permease protein